MPRVIVRTVTLTVQLRRPCLPVREARPEPARSGSRKLGNLNAVAAAPARVPPQPQDSDSDSELSYDGYLGPDPRSGGLYRD